MLKIMIFLWFWSFSVFWYDFNTIFLWFCSVFLLWFWYDFFDFLMVLESFRFLDMIFLWFWGTSVFLIWFRYCFFPVIFFTPVAGFRLYLLVPSSGPSYTSHPCRRTLATPSTPRRRTPTTLFTPVAGPTSHPVARQWNQRNSLISNFGFFLILLDLHGRCSMLQTYRVQFEHKLYHFVGEAGKKKRFSMLLLAEFRV